MNRPPTWGSSARRGLFIGRGLSLGRQVRDGPDRSVPKTAATPAGVPLTRRHEAPQGVHPVTTPRIAHGPDGPQKAAASRSEGFGEAINSDSFPRTGRHGLLWTMALHRGRGRCGCSVCPSRARWKGKRRGTTGNSRGRQTVSGRKVGEEETLRVVLRPQGLQAIPIGSCERSPGTGRVGGQVRFGDVMTGSERLHHVHGVA